MIALSQCYKLLQGSWRVCISFFGQIHLYFGQIHPLMFVVVNFFRLNSNQFLVILIRSSELASYSFLISQNYKKKHLSDF